MVDDKIKFGKYILQQVYSTMRLIRRMYTFLDETSFRYLFQALVRPYLEYADAAWSLFTKKDINTIENAQKRATKLKCALGVFHSSVWVMQHRQVAGLLLAHSKYFLSV